jgi:hypothetical protein
MALAGPRRVIPLVVLLLLAACSSHESTDRSSSRTPLGEPTSNRSPSPLVGTATSPPPPVPSGPQQSGGPSQPPVVWIGGTLTEVDRDRVVVQEAFGAVVTLQQLGRGATAFFEVAGDAWARVSSPTSVEPGGPVCVETLLDGETLLALRVFLGASCGPA